MINKLSNGPIFKIYCNICNFFLQFLHLNRYLIMKTHVLEYQYLLVFMYFFFSMEKIKYDYNS